MKKVLLVSHYTQAAGPVQKMNSYFRNKKKYNVITICHPLFPKDKLKSIYNSNKKSGHFKIFWLSQFLVEGLVNYFIIKYKLKEDHFDFAICFDPLSFFHTYVLKSVLKISTISYLNVDYSQNRYNNQLLNLAYQKLNKFAYVNSDYFLPITNNFIKIIDLHYLFKPKNKILKIRHSVNLSKIKLIKVAEKIPNSIVFIGSLYYSVEFENLFSSLAELKEEGIKFTFDIYAVGNTKKIMNLIKKMGLKKEVNLKKQVEYNKLINTILPYYMIGVCPYQINTNFVHEADDLTTKMVDYIACGIPFVSTDISRALRKFSSKKMCFFVKDVRSWTNALATFLKNEQIYKSYSKNAYRFAQNYDEGKVYSPILNKILS